MIYTIRNEQIFSIRLRLENGKTQKNRKKLKFSAQK